MKFQRFLMIAILASTVGIYTTSRASETDLTSEATLASDVGSTSQSSDEDMNVDAFGGPGGGGHGGDHGGFHPGPGGHGGFHPGPGDHGGGHEWHPHPGPGHVHYNPFPHHGGYYPWPHWNRPGWVRPIYYWPWANVRIVTCTAEDSFGNQYPVTETGYYGIVYQGRIQEIEDASINRCYQESGGDPACRLEGCTPGY